MSAVSDADRAWQCFGPDSPERTALLALSAHLGVDLRPRAVELRPGTMFEVEGVDPDGALLVQVVVNRGRYTSQQRNKVLADMFKLSWLRSTRFPQARVGMLLNENTSAVFKPLSWTFLAAQELRFELFVVAPDSTVTTM